MFAVGSRQSLAEHWPGRLSERTANAFEMFGMMVWGINTTFDYVAHPTFPAVGKAECYIKK